MAPMLRNLFFRTVHGVKARPILTPSRVLPRPVTSLPRVRVAQYAQWNQGPYREASRPPRQSILIRWVNSRSFYTTLVVIGAVGATGYVYNLEEVPISGRRRFNIVNSEMERGVAETQYKAFIKELGPTILPPWHPETLRVKRVMARLIAGLSNLEDQGITQSGQEAAVTSGKAPWTKEKGLDAWEVNVVNADILNAAVLPGNKVFIFTKMLEVCKDDTGIATVLGHEMAHSICHHAAERMSTQSIARIATLGFLGFALFDLGLSSAIGSYLLYGYLAYDYLWDKPMSRIQESEADHLGLLLMAASCYDPRASVSFWQRMNQISGTERAIPEFLSTHPDDRTRIKQLAGWMESAQLKYDSSECGTYKGWTREFLRSLKDYP